MWSHSVICLIFGLTILGMTPIFAESHFEDPESYPIIVVPPEVALQPTDLQPITDQYNFTYTITAFQSGSTVAQQEEIVRMIFQDFWGQHIPNVDFIYVKGADPADVYGHIEMRGSCGIGEGCGGGDGPNTWCVARNTTGTFVNGKLAPILGHEIGHCLGLNHYTGQFAFNCMMTPTLQPSLTQCNAEINDLKNLWIGAVCHIALCMEEGVALTNGIFESLVPSKTPIQGDILTLTFTIKNVGNTQIVQPVWIYDFTDNKQLFFSSTGILLPSETKSIDFTWNITDSIIGNHSITGWYIPVRDEEVTPDDNQVKFLIEVFGVAPPPPPPPPFCEPDVCNDNNECTIDTCDEITDTCSNIPDVGKVCGIAGTCDASAMCIEPPPPPPVDNLERRVTNLEGNMTIAQGDIISNENRITALEASVTGLQTSLEGHTGTVLSGPHINGTSFLAVEGEMALEEPVVNNLVIIVVIVIFGVAIIIIVSIRTKKQ